MKNSKKILTKVSIALASLCVFSTICVQASSSRESYTQAVYGAKNSYIGSSNSKSTDNQVVFDKITNDWDSFDTLVTWVANSNKKQISEDYYLSEGDGALMDHKSTSNVRLCWKNDSWTPLSGKVSGQVAYY